MLYQLLFLPLVLSMRHVIRNTPKLRQQGCHGDIDLGEVIAETKVNSPEACLEMCKKNSACKSAMLLGQLCRMFAPSSCQGFIQLSNMAGSSRYLVGQDASVTSFQSAMEKCNSLRAHSVHINSKEEHDMIKKYIQDVGLTCDLLWTGGRSPVAGSADITDWRWYYNNDFSGASEPFTYLAWGLHQPNNYADKQYYMVLTANLNYDFNDFRHRVTHRSSCFLCECPLLW